MDFRLLGGSWGLMSGLIMGITGVVIWLFRVAGILTKSPKPSTPIPE